MMGVFATCDASSLVSPPGTEDIALEYLGDTVAAMGRLVAPDVEVQVGGKPLADPRLTYTSSDPSVLEITPDGQLYMRRLGTASLVISLRSSLLPSSAPSLTKQIQVVAESLSISATALNLGAVGASAVVAATAFDFNGFEIADPPIRWESSLPAAVAVTQRGIITAKGPGDAQVRAILGPDTAIVSVNVNQVLARYAMSHEDVTLEALGDTITISASGRDANGNPIPPSSQTAPVWTSRDPSAVDVSSSGKATARRNASTWIVAQRGVVADSVRFTVDQRAVRVVISAARFDIDALNGQLQLSAIGFDRNSNPDGNSLPSWSSLDPNTAQVHPTLGVVTGLAVGTAQIVAAIDGGADTVFVNVANAVAQLVLTPPTLTMTSVFDTAQLAVAAYNSRGSPVLTEVTWRSTDPAIVAIGPNSRIEARGVGTARIIASSGALADTTVVTVTNNPAIIDIAETDVSLSFVNQTASPTINIRNTRGDVLPRTAVTWRADDPAILAVSTTGFITALGVGTTTVRATAGSLGDSVRVTVTNNPTSIVVSAERDTVTAVGRTVLYSGEVRNAGNAVLVGYPISWRSTNTAIASVSSAGLVTALATGTTFIIGTAGPVADTITIVVRNPSVLWVDNAVIVVERFGTLSRPYANIQDAVAAADAGDTVFVRRGFGYSESIALNRRIVLMGDSAAFVSGGRNPALLPAIAHDSGAAGISATTTAQLVIRYFAMTHSLDGPAVNTSGADVRIDNFYINPGPSSVKIGRGILVRDAPTFAALADIVVRNVRGYGVRLERVTQGQVDRASVFGVDSISGTRGAGIDVYRGSMNDVRFAFVRETQGPAILLDSTSTGSVLDSDLAGRSILVRVRGVSGAITAVDRNRFDLSVAPGAADTRGSANDGRSGLEIVSSSNVQVRENTFTETGSAVMDGVRLIQAKGGGAFLGVTLFRNRFQGGRYSVRTERSSWTMTESASDGAAAGVFATDADTVQLLGDTVSATTGDACVSSTGNAARIDITGGVFSRCGTAGTTGGRAIAVSGSSSTTLTVRSATLGGPNQTAIDFSGRDLTARGNTIVGKGARTVTGFVAGGAIDAIASSTATIKGNTVTDYSGLTGLLIDAGTLALDSNIVARNRIGVHVANWFSASGIDNDFYDSELLAVQNGRAVTLTLSGNWWGDARGPRRAAAPAAAGDSVGALVATGTLGAAAANPGLVASGIRIVRGDGQTAARRAVLPLALTARVTDDAGRPVGGVPVTFTITSGGGSVSSGTVTTNASGLAEVTLTLGNGPGANTVRASFVGPGGATVAVTFTATGT
jgi:hypothetical protein